MPATGASAAGGRWCPTPEQVMLLEGMYRGGLKTPTATQIQQITARLSIYGKVQGKNVFYWFQNHKARDRQKLRKKVMAFHHLPPHSSLHDHTSFLVNHQGGKVEDGSSSCERIIDQMKVDLPCDNTSCKVMCDCSLMTMMMMDHMSTTPYCTRVPPKTLQLFPTTTNPLKDDHHSTTSKP